MVYTPNRKFYKPSAGSILKGTAKKIAGKALGFMPATSPLDVGFLSSISRGAIIPAMATTIGKEVYDNKKHLDLMAKNQTEARQRIKKEDMFNQDPMYKFNLASRYGGDSIGDGTIKKEPEDIQDIIDQGKTSSGGTKESSKPKPTGASTSNEPDYLKQSAPNNISQGEPDRLKYSTPKTGFKDNPDFKGFNERKIMTDFASFVSGQKPTGVMNMRETMNFIKQAKKNKDTVQNYFNKYFNRNKTS